MSCGLNFKAVRRQMSQIPSLTPSVTRGVTWCLACLTVALLPMTAAQAQSPKPERLIVHEWGVLTTISLPDGKTVNWSPLEVLAPQPGFVQTFPVTPSQHPVKLDLPAVFFRVDRPMEVAMSLQWLDGYFASCYPRAEILDHMLSWRQTTLMPDAAFPLPQESSASHYYQARKTTASFVRVDYFGHKQYERFLTLRAIGKLRLPLSVSVNQEEFTLTQPNASPDQRVTQAILIENIDNKIGFALIDLKADGPTVSPRLKHDANFDLANAKLRKLLNQQGLYPDEAATALAGVRQDWFAPGVRVIYILPRPMIDGPLKMEITPTPTEHLRLYAVQVELITPRLLREVKQWLVGLDPKDTAAQGVFMRSSSLARPMLTQLLAEMENDHAQLHLCDKINMLLEQPMAQK